MSGRGWVYVWVGVGGCLHGAAGDIGVALGERVVVSGSGRGCESVSRSGCDCGCGFLWV